ncbi:unnamed protein product [Triticum turgidum subsp. durum]|uniref:Uncharacterized protein n=1 Tax=Triticum turgidum subsp. durum TaxID=4567 RepID=A0A9R1C378_TRITD|nr:unnamed protein product [Triticum turgidum subsp. durum]
MAKRLANPVAVKRVTAYQPHLFAICQQTAKILCHLLAHGKEMGWEAKSKGGAGGKTKSKWGTEIKGKGSLEPWSHAYTWEEDFTASDDDEDELEVEERRPEKPKKIKAAAKDKEDDKKKKKPARTCIQIEEIPEENTAGCDAICKAFAMGNGKGKAKELSPQDAALLIQMNYRAHLTHRSQVLSCLRDLALAKAMLKELRSLFYNLSYRRRLLHDHEEHQRFSEKIIVLLLTVDALELLHTLVKTITSETKNK